LLQIETCSNVVRSDPSLIGQILRNLLSNAVKYTRHGQVLLRCVAESAVCRIDVVDTGIGIPADQLAYIYDEFFQVGVSPGEPRDGYGLGLSIVSRLVKLLGLTLSVESEPGRGTRFCLKVPAGTAHLNAGGGSARLESTRSDRRAQCRILLVEDDAGVRDATRMLLKAEGYEISLASSYLEAMEQASTGAPIDLLITDYHLSGGETGVEVFEALRLRHDGDLKAILVTGDTSSVVQEVASRGQLRVVSKPVKAEQLLMLINELSASGSGACDRQASAATSSRRYALGTNT
jgi:two-component system CheB/CheR fusion protein